MDDDSNVPLTRTKGQQIEEPVIKSTQDEPPVITTKVIEKPVKVKKPRAPKTPAQLEAFKKASEKRQKNIELKKLEKKVEASKILLEHEERTKAETKAKPKAKKQIIREDDDTESDEPQIVYIRKKKPKKTIIVQSESESESEPEIEIKHRKSFGTSHQSKQNVKAITKIEPIKRPNHNFFAD